ncbi:hypothetical protein MASR2M66_14130 [Chloroflexota bacterium]
MKAIIEKHQVLIFFTLTTVIGYLPWAITGKPNWFIYGMPISGIILTAILKGMPGITDQLKSAINIKAPVSEYLKIILLLVSVNIATLLLAFLMFGDIPTFNMIKNETIYIPQLLVLILLGGPIVEEVFGLRGYALPELLRKYSPLMSSLIVGFYFGAWHLVEFFRPGSTQYAIGLNYYPVFIITEIASSIIMTYFYLRNNKNLFLGGIFFHWMMNNAAILFQTDLTFSQMNIAPKMNVHYFIIYSVLMWMVSIYIVIKSKYYTNYDHMQNHPITTSN